MNRHLATSSAVIAMLMLSSCIGYDEELTIHENLSGEASVILTLPNVLISKWEKVGAELEKEKIEKRLEKVSGVTLTSYHRTEGGQPTITMKFKFSSLEKLNEAIAANPPAAVWAGQFTITKEEGGKTKIDRKLGVGDAGSELPAGLKAMYKTHFDGTIVATNSKQYNSPAKDVRFYYPDLNAMLAQQPVHSVTTAKGWPWTLILICVAAIAGAAWYGWEYFGKKAPAGPSFAPTTAPPTPAPVPAPSAPAPSAQQASPPAAPSPATPTPQRPAPPQPRRPGPPQPRPPGAPPQP